MAALLKLDQTTIEEIVAETAAQCGELILVANYNTPAQLVISGTKAAVTMACQKAKERKGRGIELKVSGAFHSPMMAEANRELAPLLRKAVWSKPKFPVYCNAHGKAVTDGESARESLLAQMTSSVLWMDVMLGINEGAYFYRISSSVTATDVTGGFIKALAFGLLVTTVCCRQGYYTNKRRDSVGPEAVGNATTSAVVISCVLILAADYIITSFLL